MAPTCSIIIENEQMQQEGNFVDLGSRLTKHGRYVSEIEQRNEIARNLSKNEKCHL